MKKLESNSQSLKIKDCEDILNADMKQQAISRINLLNRLRKVSMRSGFLS